MADVVCISPVDGREVVRRPSSSAAEIEAAAAAARKAQVAWKRVPLAERGKILGKAVDAMLATLATLALAQTKPSPPAEAHVTLDGKSISIKYSAPSVRGRHIFGGLVPYGKVWRAGANEATALHTDANLDLGGLKVPKGDYTLYILPEDNRWTLIVNKQTGQWGTEYDQKQDLGRTAMKMAKPPAPIETYKMTLSGSGKKGKLQLEWENTIASVDISAK